MRKYFMTAFVVAAMLVFATSGFALEKTAMRLNPADESGWDAAASCTVYYANNCTGWVWISSGFSPLESFGQVLEPCCQDGVLTATQTRVFTSDLPGYGFTGTLAVSPVVNGNCPGVAYQSIPFLPTSGTNDSQIWAGIPAGTVVLSYITGNSPYVSEMAVIADHPSASGTDPPQCGLCYPTTRVNHSWYYGLSFSICPGTPWIIDGTCTAELWNWKGYFNCPPVSVEESSWGAVKSLYR